MMKKHRWIRSVLTGVVLAVCLGVFCHTDRAEAAVQDVMTGKGGWDWIFWGTAGEETEGRSRSYGRVCNRETGEVLSSGWHKVDGYWYYFTKKGYTVDQFHGGYQIGDRMGLGIYESEEIEDADPPVRYRWKKTSEGRWMYAVAEDGSPLKDRKAWISGKLYLFDPDGYLPSAGWYRSPSEGKWYYILPSQACATGWKKLDGKWYFFDYSTGQMAQGGSFDTSAPFDQEPQYYIFNSGGVMRTFEGWLQGSDGAWYRSQADGRAVLRWATVKEKDYYFEPSLGGRMACSSDETEWFQNGRYLRPDGTATPRRYLWHADGDLWWFGRGSYYPVETTVTINGWTYDFNTEGYCVGGQSLVGNEQVCYIREEEEGVVQWDESMNLSEQDLYLMAATIYTEAGGEAYEGQVAVANVLLNRLRSGKYGKTLEDVVYQPYQFSVTGWRSFKRSLIHGGSSTAMQAAREALLGKNVIGGFDSFRMHQGYDLTKLKEYYILGSHVFYYD